VLIQSNDELQEEKEQTDELILHFKNELWRHHEESTPTFSLFRGYEVQRNVCLSILQLDHGAKLMTDQFTEAWESAGQFDNMQNLLCEMLVRADLELEDWTLLFYPIADVAARALFYYMTLEKQLRQRRQVDFAFIPVRSIRIVDHSSEQKNMVVIT